MFYSQSFLARKGPLGTVWCAAHLQHRLKRSHYTSTDISSTVDRIMFPEVPIALRMSGHLLLGVVRIYSKKVEYLYRDCNVVLVGLKKAFTNVDVNLPENACTAKFEAITLPQSLDLDALEIDVDSFDRSPDSHLRSREDITLNDQIPTGFDPYVVVTIDEDMFPPEEDPNLGGRLMDEIGRTTTVDNNDCFPDTNTSIQTDVIHDSGGFQDPGPSNQTEILTDVMDFEEPAVHTQTEVIDTGVTVDSPEVRRDNDFGPKNPPSVIPDIQNDTNVPPVHPDDALHEKRVPSPIPEDILPSRVRTTPSPRRSQSPLSFDLSGGHEISDTHASSGQVFDLLPSPPVQAQQPTPPVQAQPPTPPVQAQQPPRRKRKRKNFYDKDVVLTNKSMKKGLQDCSDILRSRGVIPSTSLGIRKLRNHQNMEHAFSVPSFSGLCNDICNLFQKDYISTKPHLVLEPETNQDTPVAASSAPANEDIVEHSNASCSAPVTEPVLQPANLTSHAPEIESNFEARAAESPADMEIEYQRHADDHNFDDVLPELCPSSARVSPSPGSFIPSSRRDDFTPISTKSFGLESVSEDGTAVSARTNYSELETPGANVGGFGDANFRLSDIPELMDSAEADLSFLEADNTPGTPAGLQGSQGIDTLSVRTRAVAQYLKQHSPDSLPSENQSGDLSLNKILQGKTRKLCARMFYETLVLKSYGLIDVQQERPYGDIALKLTSALPKADL